MLLVEGFQKFVGIPFGISRIFESLMPQQIGANRHKNRSIQVKSRCSQFGIMAGGMVKGEGRILGIGQFSFTRSGKNHDFG
jgi:hypothetical protein